jgi:hypothetical protein
MLERWTDLTRFLDNPCIPLDNNAAERALRGPVVGRKNHYGSKSLRGTQVAALFYTLCESAKLVGADPHMYLLTATEAALATPGAVTLPDALPSASTASSCSSLPRLRCSPRARARTYHHYWVSERRTKNEEPHRFVSVGQNSYTARRRFAPITTRGPTDHDGVDWVITMPRTD